MSFADFRSKKTTPPPVTRLVSDPLTPPGWAQVMQHPLQSKGVIITNLNYALDPYKIPLVFFVRTLPELGFCIFECILVNDGRLESSCLPIRLE